MSIHKIVVSGLLFAQLWQNVFYVENAEGTLTAEEICDYVDTHYVEAIRAPILSDVTINSIQSLGVGAAVGSGFTKPIAKTGAHSPFNLVIPFAAYVLRLNTGLAGRKFRGRKYIPGIRTGDFQFGLITGQGVSSWQTPLATLNTWFCGAQGAKPLHMVIHGEPEAHDTHVTSIILSAKLGVQRRRNIGVGQ